MMREGRPASGAPVHPAAPAKAADQGLSAEQAPERGVFVTFEGGDGAGKTTHIRFLANALSAMGREVVCLREPGGTEVGEQLRGVVLNPANSDICDGSELLIFEAARAQLVSQVIAPALERGAVVLCDRFTDSTVAYQGYGRGLDAIVRGGGECLCVPGHRARSHYLAGGRQRRRGPGARHAPRRGRSHGASRRGFPRPRERGVFGDRGREPAPRAPGALERAQIAYGRAGVRPAGGPVPVDGRSRARQRGLLRAPRRAPHP